MNRVVRSAFFFLCVVGAIALVRDTRFQGHDFVVFWRAGQALLMSNELYGMARSGMVFKYPPWIAPLFFPFAFLPLIWAKWLWGVLQVASLAYVFRWIRTEVSWAIAAGVLCIFWGIWVVHALDGQVSLFFLALALWGFNRNGWAGHFLIVWALSAKIFGVFALANLDRSFFNFRRLASIGVVLLLAFTTSWFVTSDRGPFDFIQGWMSAAGSGGTHLGLSKIYGRDNQGLPALWVRVSGIRPEGTFGEAWNAIILALLVGFGWAGASRRLSANEKWVGWLGLSCVIHPLAWFHQFVFAYPLVAMSLDRAVQSRSRIAVAISGLGLIAVATITAKTFGTLGAWLELYSIKSLGVLLSAGALVWAQRSATTVKVGVPSS